MTKAMNNLFTALDKALKDDKQYSKDEILDLFKHLTAEKPKVKRAKNSYHFFLGDSEVRDAVKDQNKDASSKEILSLMAGKWKGLQDKEKEKYVAQSKAEKETMPKVVKVQKERVRAKNSYQFFMGDVDVREEVKSENSDAESKDILKFMAARWKGLDDEDKEKYVVMANEDKLKFTKTPFDVFKAQCSDSDNAESQWEELSDSEQEEYGKVKAVKKTTEKKTKQPKSALKLYQSDKDVRAEMKEENPEAKAVEITKMLSENWKEMSDEEKEPFKEMAKKEKVKHTLLSSEPSLVRSVST